MTISLNLKTALTQINKIAENFAKSAIYTDTHDDDSLTVVGYVDKVAIQNYFQVSIFFDGKIEIYREGKIVKELTYQLPYGHKIADKVMNNINELIN
jgi:hypothetical protein